MELATALEHRANGLNKIKIHLPLLRKYKKCAEGTLVPSFLSQAIRLVEVEDRIRGKVEEIILEGSSLFLVDVHLKGHTGNQRINVELDGDEGLAIDTCATVSKILGSWIEEEDLIQGKFILEVSSPGADKPLTNRRQYKKHVGRQLKVQTTEGLEISGLLKSVATDQIEIEETKTKEPLMVSFDQIKSSNVIISFK